MKKRITVNLDEHNIEWLRRESIATRRPVSGLVDLLIDHAKRIRKHEDRRED